MAQEVLDEQMAGGVFWGGSSVLLFTSLATLLHATAEEVLGKLDGPLSP